MATFSPFGLQSCDTRTSSPWNAKANQTYQINPTYAIPLNDGDPVFVVGGYIQLFDATAQTAAIAGTGPSALGVFRGCNYNQIGTGYNVPFQRSWKGINDVVPGSAVYAVVEDDLTSIFKVQSSSALGVQVTATYQNASFVYNAATPASNANQTSTVSLSATTVNFGAANSANYPIKVVGIFDAANGGAYNSNPTLNQWTTTGANAVVCPFPILLVQFNNHLTRPGTPGAN